MIATLVLLPDDLQDTDLGKPDQRAAQSHPGMAADKIEQNAGLRWAVFLQMMQHGRNVMIRRVHGGVQTCHEGKVDSLLHRLVAQIKHAIVIDDCGGVMLEQIKGIARAG